MVKTSTNTGFIDSWQLALTLPATVCAPNGEPPPTEALTASRADPSTVQLGWSTAACPATNYHLLYGSIETLPTYALSGAICGLGPLGSYAWPGVPSGNLWFVVVADDASSTEGTWGQTEPPGSRNGASASGLCGFTARTNATCP